MPVARGEEGGKEGRGRKGKRGQNGGKGGMEIRGRVERMEERTGGL